MSVLVYALGVFSAVGALLFVLHLARAQRMRERHAVWWLLGTLVTVVVAILPEVPAALARWLGVEVPANLVFFLSIALLALVGVQFSVELTLLEEKTRILAEEVALMRITVSNLAEQTATESVDESGVVTLRKGESHPEASG